MKKKAAVDHNANIQYRPGESFGRFLAIQANKWGISRQEAARRLAIMGAFELSLDLYPLVVNAAESFGGVRGFEIACKHLNGAFHGASIVCPKPDIFTDPKKKREFALRVLREMTMRNAGFYRVETETKQVEHEQLEGQQLVE